LSAADGTMAGHFSDEISEAVVQIDTEFGERRGMTPVALLAGFGRSARLCRFAR
jgi:hypothetical protein